MPSSSPTALAIDYVGGATHAIDKSNRILLPPAWRKAGMAANFFVIYIEKKNHLLVFPPDAFRTFVQTLRDETADKIDLGHMEGELNEQLREMKLDRFGRLQLPADLLAKAGIKGKGKLSGRFDKFELSVPDDERPKSQAKIQAGLNLANKLETV